MKVLFLMFNYDDANVSDSMYNSLVAEFIANGHEVSVVAFEKSRRETGIYREGQAEVLRVKTMPLMNVGPVAKGIANLLMPFQYRRALRRFYDGRKFDLIITPTPPITLTGIARSLKKQNQAKVYLILRDIFPQNAVDVGFMSKRNPLYLYFRRQEKALYRIADTIGAMTRGNVEYILRHNPEVKAEKLHILPNWNKAAGIPDLSGSDIREKYGLTGKFVVLFGGTLGISQKVDNLIDLAKLNTDKNDLTLLVVGKGTHKKYLEKRIIEEGLSNILVLDYLPRADYEKIAMVADVGLISLNEKFTIPNIPSRTLAYYNLKKPVFAIVDPNTDYGEMLAGDQTGYCCVYGDHESYRKHFNALYSGKELRSRMGENGYQALTTKYTPRRTYEIILQHCGLQELQDSL